MSQTVIHVCLKYVDIIFVLICPESINLDFMLSYTAVSWYRVFHGTKVYQMLL